MARRIKRARIIKKDDGPDVAASPRRARPVAISEQCATCRHWTGGTKCRAFPNGIPQSLLKGKLDHRRPYPNDRGFRYAPSGVTDV